MNIRSIAAYFKERFPPVNMLLFSILFLTVYSVTVYFSPAPYPNTSFKIAIGVTATISFFFRLRFFDEIKDFEIDSINHPKRVLQSGRISLRQLKLISAILTISEVVWSCYNGTVTIICWLVAVGYSLLMRYEFFSSRFLKERLFLYAATHMLVMPLIIVWIWSAFYKDGFWHPALYLLTTLSFLGGFCFEIARKIHAPNAEKPTVDSYSKSLGFVAAVVCVLFFMLAGIAVQCYLLYCLQSRLWAYLLIVLLYVITSFLYAIAVDRKEEKRLRVAELFVSLFMLFSYVSIIIETHF